MAEKDKSDSDRKDQNLILARDRYKSIKVLGRGSYGEVWLVSPLESTGDSRTKPKQCVLKRVSLGNSSEDERKELIAAEQEAQLLSSLKHPNIVSYVESFRSRDRHLNIVMAFCEGGDLYTKLKYRKKQLLDEEQIFEWFIQITLALQYMHKRSILHRDLKTQNIFLTKNDIIKVGDLGIARILTNNGADLATTVIGTPYYMSPEIFSNRPYGPKSDIWSLGCCVYEMATLEHAFKAGDMTSLMMKIIRGNTPTLPTADRYSKDLTQLINNMLSKDEDQRPTASDILWTPCVKEHVTKLYKKTQERCRPFLANPSNRSAEMKAAPSSANNHPTFELTPKPRMGLPPRNLERPKSGTDGVPNAARLRRQEQRSRIQQKLPDTPKLPISKSTSEEEAESSAINKAFIANIRHNDTLARFKRGSSSPNTPTPSCPIDEDKDDEPSSSSSTLTSAPRERRRERQQSTVESKVQLEKESDENSAPIYDRSISNDGQIEAVEQERKQKVEINEFLNELSATLGPRARASSVRNETIDRTIITTANIIKLYEGLKEACLKDISKDKLTQVLKLLNQVSEGEWKSQIVKIIGEELYEKHSPSIYMMKHYEHHCL